MNEFTFGPWMNQDKQYGTSVDVPVENYCEHCGEYLSFHTQQDCEEESPPTAACVRQSRGLQLTPRYKPIMKRPYRSPIEIPSLYSIRNLLSGKKFIELGCASGDLAFEASKYASEVVGIDKNHEWIDNANKALKKRCTPNITFSTFDVLSALINKSTDFDRLVGDVYYQWRYPNVEVQTLEALSSYMHTYPSQFPNGATVLCPFYLQYESNVDPNSVNINKYGRHIYENYDEIIFFKTSDKDFSPENGRSLVSNLKTNPLCQVGIINLSATSSTSKFSLTQRLLHQVK